MGQGTIYINDALHGLIRLSDYEKRIISSVGFNRLHDVYQNSTVYLTYPSNRTKRFEHSLGTMKLCSDMFYYSIANAEEKDLDSFFGIAEKEIKEEMKEISKSALDYSDYIVEFPKDLNLNEVKYEEFSKSLIPHVVTDKHKILYTILMQSIRVAALLHDIGHPPFSHVVESAMTEVYKEDYEVNRNSSFIVAIKDLLNNESISSVHLHELIGKQLTRNTLKSVLKEKKEKSTNLFEIIVAGCVSNIFEETTPFWGALHRIIDSDLDGDRLDYVTRDPTNSGIKCGSNDYSRIILDMKMIMERGKKNNCKIPYFCVPVKAINAVEDFFQRRFNGYKNIVFHHRVQKTDYLLKDIVYRLLKENVTNNGRHVDGLDISGLWGPLEGGTDIQKDLALIQWNDSWLMTFLEYEYYIVKEFHKIEIDISNKDGFILQREMKELLLNKKFFHSIIKRCEDQRVIDKYFRKYFLDSLGDIDAIINELNDISDKTNRTSGKDGKSSQKSKKDGKIVVDGMISYFKELKDDRFKSCALSLTSRRINAIYGVNKKEMEELIKESVTNACKKYFKKNFASNIIVFPDYKTGISDTVNFYDNSFQKVEINKISNIQNVILAEQQFLPVFYLYILLNDNVTNISLEEKKKVLELSGKEIGINLGKRISNGLNDLRTTNGGANLYV